MMFLSPRRGSDELTDVLRLPGQTPDFFPPDLSELTLTVAGGAGWEGGLTEARARGLCFQLTPRQSAAGEADEEKAVQSPW